MILLETCVDAFMKYGVQITENIPADDSYGVAQLRQTPDTEYHRTGAVVWVVKSDPNADQKLLDAIKCGLRGGIQQTHRL